MEPPAPAAAAISDLSARFSAAASRASRLRASVRADSAASRSVPHSPRSTRAVASALERASRRASVSAPPPFGAPGVLVQLEGRHFFCV
jgi:hypothetical protein